MKSILIIITLLLLTGCSYEEVVKDTANKIYTECDGDVITTLHISSGFDYIEITCTKSPKEWSE